MNYNQQLVTDKYLELKIKFIMIIKLYTIFFKVLQKKDFDFLKGSTAKYDFANIWLTN